MLKRLLLLFSLLIFAIPGPDCFAGGVGTGGAEFMKILPGSRSAGMGGSGMALDLGADSIYLNPAALYTPLLKNQAYFSHIGWWESVVYDYFAYIHSIRGIGVLGASFTWLRMPPLELTNKYGTPTGDILNIYDIMLNLSYAGRVAKGFSWGMNIKSIRRELGDYGKNAFAGDLGVIYRKRLNRGSKNYQEISFAAVIHNIIGTGIYFIDESNRDNFPVVVKLGTAYRPERNLSFAFDIDMLSDKRVKYHAGAEYWISEEFGLRAGYENMDDFGGLSGLCLGFSFKPDVDVDFTIKASTRKKNYFKMQLDYALRLAGGMGMVHRVALGMEFESGRRKTRKKK